MSQKNGHPMLQPHGFVIDTAPLTEFLQAFQTHVKDGETNMHCHAPSRFGKSTAVRALESRLRARRHMVPVWMHVVNYSERNKSAKFWHALRTGSMDAAATVSNSSLTQLDALLNYLRNECDLMGTTRIAFLLDEGQNLTVEQLDMVKLLTETLLRRGYRPFTLLMAQPEILLRPDALKRALRHDLVDRFFSRGHRLRGLGAKELREACHFYDKTCWPEGTDVSFTQHFVPDMWRYGWRLASVADDLWQGFLRAARALNVYTEHFEVGTKFVTKAVLHILTELATEPNQLQRLQLFDDAVRASEFIAHNDVVGDPYLAVEEIRLDLAERARKRAVRRPRT